MLIDLLDDTETAANFKTRLVAMGDEVFVSSHPTFSIAYSGNSLMMRQKQTQAVYEYRGLTERAAKKLVTLSSHGASRTTYYQSMGNDGDAVACGVNVGTDNDYQLTRVSDSNGFTVQRTETVWAASGSGWSTRRPSSSSSGVVVSTSGNSQMVWTFNGHPFCHTQSVTVTQYKFQTKSEADTLVSRNTSWGATYQSYPYGSATGYALSGTNKTAVSRYIDGDSQYTVDVTTTVLGATWV